LALRRSNPSKSTPPPPKSEKAIFDWAVQQVRKLDSQGAQKLIDARLEKEFWPDLEAGKKTGDVQLASLMGTLWTQIIKPLSTKRIAHEIAQRLATYFRTHTDRLRSREMNMMLSGQPEFQSWLS